MNLIRRLASTAWWRVRCGWALATARRSTMRNLSQLQIRRLLIVCYGNIYRSPLAAALLRRHLPGQREVRSAGFHPVSDRSSPPGHVSMCHQLGIDLGAHRSRVLIQSDLEWADGIVLMDRHNWQALSAMGASPDKLIWLGAFGNKVEVPDPYGKQEAAAIAVVRQIGHCSQLLADAISMPTGPAANSRTQVGQARNR